MPGAGNYPAGFGPAGFSPIVPSTGRREVLPIAAFYDPSLRAFPYDSTGQIVAVHPVDQEVAIRVTVPLGSIKCSPLVGLNWKRIRAASKLTLQRVIDDEVRRSLKPTIDAGHIRLNGSPLHPEAKGRPLFIVDYVNLRLPPSLQTTTPLVAGT